MRMRSARRVMAAAFYAIFAMNSSYPIRKPLQLAPNPAELSLARRDPRRSWPSISPTTADVPADFDARVAFLRRWQRTLHEAGLVGLALARRARRPRRHA